jgi:hypothetical protein
MTVPGRGGEGRADDTVPGCGDEGRADGAVPRRFDVEEERGAVVEAHVEEVARWRWTRRTRRRVCGGEMTGLPFRSSDTLKKKNSSNGHDDIINVRRYI